MPAGHSARGGKKGGKSSGGKRKLLNFKHGSGMKRKSKSGAVGTPNRGGKR